MASRIEFAPVVRFGSRAPLEVSNFQWSLPAGAGMLLAIVARRSVHLTALVSRHKDLAVIERPDAYLVELNEALRVAGGSDWGHAAREYQVVVGQ